MITMNYLKFSLKMEMFFFEANGNNFRINYKDGKPLYKTNKITEILFNRDGEEIPNDSDGIIGIRKIN